MSIKYVNNFTPKVTLDIKTAIRPDIDVAPLKEPDKWSYAAIVVMLQYLSRSPWPDIKLAINQVVHHTHYPNLSHKVSIKCICYDLKGI